MPPSAKGLVVSVTDAAGRRSPARGLAAWLAGAAPARARGTVDIALVDDRTMRRLNGTYRRQRKTTDVLSFPAGDAPRALGSRFLGDIAISLDAARRQARALGHPVGQEVRILALHGLLHLLGYDHETDQGEMRRAEERLRRRAGLPAGLIARRPGRRTHG
jgi:probable rRNA maturation factor